MVEMRKSSRCPTPAHVACAAVTGAQATELTIDRLFDAPSLSGPTVLGPHVAPDGSRVTYLQGKPDNKNQLDLWEYDIRDGHSRILVDSRILEPKNANLSDEEMNRRERQRTAALSGILEYCFAPSGTALLFPFGGEVYYYDFTQPAGQALMKITRDRGFVTDASVSPKGGYIAYVRDQNLFVHELATRADRALTRDGKGPIRNGTAEFVAQEEMNRSTGYWWSPDETQVAFVRVDESPVNVTQRFEIAADNVATYDQRYPAAGGANVAVRLGVVDVRRGTTKWIDLGPNDDFYLARVTWCPDGRTIALQRESRDQRTLDLLFADSRTGASRVVLSETSNTWIELNDELTFLKQSPEFIWASARDGFTHLYLYGIDGRLIRRLTEGNWDVDDFRARAVKGVNESRREIYFTATKSTPLERQLYSTSLDSGDANAIRRISQEDGVHRVSMPSNSRFYVDTFESITQPARVSIHRTDGAFVAYLLENRLDEYHPDFPFLADNAVAEFGQLTAADGQALHYQLFKPPHFNPRKRYPVIVEVYGGPGVQRVLNRWSGAAFTQILTRAGYLVFQLDNRGTASRGTVFQAAIHRHLGQTEVVDQIHGARWLASQPFVDPQRIGVWGWSYGGYMTLMLMFKAPALFSAGAAGAPVVDWTLYDTHYTERYLDRPQDNPQGYAASSVLPYVRDLRGKLLIMHGMADDNVLFLNSTMLFRKLQDLGKPFDVMVYPGAKHGLLRQNDGRHAYAQLLRFFDDSLKR